jgi:hypothetical protein
MSDDEREVTVQISMTGEAATTAALALTAGIVCLRQVEHSRLARGLDAQTATVHLDWLEWLRSIIERVAKTPTA